MRPALTSLPSHAGRAAMSEGRGRSRAIDVSELDKRIIEHLQEDGRRPFTQIAADLGVSEAAVRARTNRLIEKRDPPGRRRDRPAQARASSSGR